MIATARTRHRRHANPYTLRGPLAVPDWEALFGRAAPLALDIGCGAGRFTCELAAARPDLNVLGVEIRPHLVAAVQAAASAQGLPHVRALLANANLQLLELLPRGGVAMVTINFPDPWYKKRHHKRRVVQPAFLAGLWPALAVNAEIHAMSDYPPVAVSMRAALQGCPGLRGRQPPNTFAACSTTGLTSEREIKHLQRDEPIYRMCFVRSEWESP